MPHPASRYAVIGAAACVSTSAGTITSSRVVAGGLVPQPTRLDAVERALVGQPASPEAAATAAAQSAAALGDDVIGDVYASADYRREVAAVFVGQAIAAALAGAR
jgi:carbon-monoxide dehydrogenase medium subunit